MTTDETTWYECSKCGKPCDVRAIFYPPGLPQRMSASWVSLCCNAHASVRSSQPSPQPKPEGEG